MKEPSNNDVLVALTRAFENGDLNFVELVNKMSFGYKVELQRNQQANEQSKAR